MSTITYHSISDGKTPISVETRRFKRQMRLLKLLGTRVLNLDEYLRGEKGVLITFDDGFKDVCLNALPILKENNFPAVIFVNSSLVGGRADFATRDEDKRRELCTLSELKELEAGGVAIANHGYRHRQLSSLSEDEIWAEYEGGADWIKNNFSRNSFPDVFVFPKGAKSEGVVRFLRGRGVRVLTERVDIYNDTSLLGFWLKTIPCYLYLRKRVIELIHAFGIRF